MRCSECGAKHIVMKTVYWREEGDEAERSFLCPGCYEEVADEVMIVPGPVYCFGTCRGWSALVPQRDLWGLRVTTLGPLFDYHGCPSVAGALRGLRLPGGTGVVGVFVRSNR